VKEANEDKDYFPAFLMGKSLQTFVTQTAVFKTALHSLDSFGNRNVEINMLKKHNDTFLLHQLQFDESSAHAFDLGSFFNRQ